MQFFASVRDAATEVVADHILDPEDYNPLMELAEWRNILYDELVDYATTHHEHP